MSPNSTAPISETHGGDPRGVADTGSAALRDPSTLVGQQVDGKYEITAVLGAGAMAVVLAARHIFLDKEVAIKVLHPSVLAVPGVRERFLREAQATSNIAHDNVVIVTDFGVMDQGYHYLVMERLHGQSLFDWYEGRLPLAPAMAASIGAMVADGLSAVHAAGFVHRDIKPENLFVTTGEDGEELNIKIVDLGVAGLIRDATLSQPAARLTQVDMTVGTVYYMAPEQATASEIDGRTDIYALGCVLWELLTGKLLFDAETHQGVLMNHLGTEPEPPSTYAPGVPAWLDAVVLRCLAKHPNDRFPTAEALRDALAATDHATPPRPLADLDSGSELIVVPRRRRRPYVVGALIAAGIAAFVLIPRGDSVSEVAGPAIDSATISATPETSESAAVAGVPVAPAVVAPSRATLTFEVEPAGTTISRNDVVLGVSPLTVEVEASDGPVQYAMATEGHIPLALEFQAETTRTIKRTLEALPPRPAGTGAGASSLDTSRTSTAPIRQPRAGRPDAETAPATKPKEPASELWRPTRPESTP